MKAQTNSELLRETVQHLAQNYAGDMGQWNRHSNRILAAADDLERYAATDGWQPIETAPRDGTKVRVAEIDGEGNILSDTGWWVEGESIEEWDEAEDGVRVKIYEEPAEGHWATNYQLCSLEEPTHWRPALSRPATQQGEG